MNDKLVFVELHKTGGTHIGTWLADLVGGQQVGKHNRLPLSLRDRFILGSVRNPWDWYVSLWAFGCGQAGSVHKQLTRRLDLRYAWTDLSREMGRFRPSPRVTVRQTWHDLKKPVATWKSLYQDPTSADAFRKWLLLLLNPSRRYDPGEGFGFSPVSDWAGLLTYRYLKLFTSLDEDLYRNTQLSNPDTALEAWRTHRLVRFIIRNEYLEQDLLKGLESAGFKLTAETKRKLIDARSNRTNSSRRLPVSHYYDEETAALVSSRERLIIENHNYQPPQT